MSSTAALVSQHNEKNAFGFLQIVSNLKCNVQLNDVVFALGKKLP